MNTLSEHELEKMYCDFLDEVYGTVTIAGLEYETSRALAEVDPVAFRCGFADWLDAELGVTIWEKDGVYYSENPDNNDE